MNLDWRRLRAVVLESDDWGLCAWTPDEQALRVLADTPAFRTPAGRRYGGSTLESASDVNHLAEALLEFRGGDGAPPCLQANMVMASPDYARFRPPLFEADALPLLTWPDASPRWRREGMPEAVAKACASGAWWPELHGLHHLPETAWLRALRRGEADARRSHECESPICVAVEASSEYDPREPAKVRTRHLARAVALFNERFNRRPMSLCPPDYRWDEQLEADADRLGVTILQGKGEQFGMPLSRVWRLILKWRWPHVRGRRFYMPVRVPFEPCADFAPPARHVEAAHRAVRQRWNRGQPAAVSTHRVNYVHHDAPRAAIGRAALSDLIARLAKDGASFLVDAEVQSLQMRGWSMRGVGGRGALVRYYGVPLDPIRFEVPAGTTGIRVHERRGPSPVDLSLEGGVIEARLHLGETFLEWVRA